MKQKLLIIFNIRNLKCYEIVAIISKFHAVKNVCVYNMNFVVVIFIVSISLIIVQLIIRNKKSIICCLQ